MVSEQEMIKHEIQQTDDKIRWILVKPFIEKNTCLKVVVFGYF
jgi:hypothetical protein